VALPADAAADKDAGEVAAAADSNSTTPRARSTFKGNTREMNGHVFQCFNECNDKKQFSKTVEAVGEYIAKKLKDPGDMDSLTKDLTLPTIPEPEELDP